MLVQTSQGFAETVMHKYGHHCQVFTDVEALKALLNIPHASGKLARWGIAIQELDLEIGEAQCQCRCFVKVSHSW